MIARDANNGMARRPFFIELAKLSESAEVTYSAHAEFGRNWVCRGLLQGIVVWSATVA